jgi:hypothetical protein
MKRGCVAAVLFQDRTDIDQRDQEAKDGIAGKIPAVQVVKGQVAQKAPVKDIDQRQGAGQLDGI